MCVIVGGALPRPYKKGERSLAPRVYEGGGPKGRGEKSGILPNSPSHGFRRASPLLKAGAKGAVHTIRRLPRRCAPRNDTVI